MYLAQVEKGHLGNGVALSFFRAQECLHNAAIALYTFTDRVGFLVVLRGGLGAGREARAFFLRDQWMKPGPAASFGLENYFEVLLDATIGQHVVLILSSLSGDTIVASGLNTGASLRCPDGVEYPYSKYKVQKFL